MRLSGRRLPVREICRGALIGYHTFARLRVKVLLKTRVKSRTGKGLAYQGHYVPVRHRRQGCAAGQARREGGRDGVVEVLAQGVVPSTRSGQARGAAHQRAVFVRDFGQGFGEISRAVALQVVVLEHKRQ
jgi:hypothetical protein